MKNISFFLSKNFQFLEVKFSVYLNRRVFVMFLLASGKGMFRGFVISFTYHIRPNYRT